MFHKLQYISQGKTVEEQLSNIQQALDAGCSWIQLRFKNAGNEQLLAVAEKVKQLTLSYKASFIINDHPHIAKAVEADGVHLGLQDMGVLAARNILGPQKIIGGTANTFEDVCKRKEEGCNYIGLGPFRFTTTKEKLSPVLGLEGYNSILKKMEQQSINNPLYAIGGIVTEDITTLMAVGIYGIAVSEAITHHANKKQIVQELNSLLYAATHYCQ